MGTDDEGVPILTQQPAGQRTQFCIALQSASVGISELAPVAPISSITLS